MTETYGYHDKAKPLDDVMNIILRLDVKRRCRDDNLLFRPDFSDRFSVNL